MKKQISFSYELFDNDQSLDPALGQLLLASRAATALSYAPYSRFHVGAALLLSNGEIVKGGNQENASFPAGICAERVALSVAASLFPSEKITAIAISYRNDNTETPAENILSPCGICRQSLLETTGRQQRDITVILSSPAGQVIKLESAGDLLPLAFSAKDL